MIKSTERSTLDEECFVFDIHKMSFAGLNNPNFKTILENIALSKQLILLREIEFTEQFKEFI